MLNKDQAFLLHEFFNEYGHQKLWRISEKLTEKLENYLSNQEQKNLYNKFLVKNGPKFISDLEGSIYNLIKDINNTKEKVEEAPLV